MSDKPDTSEVGCSINLVTGEHYGPCKGSCGPPEAGDELARFMSCTYEEAKVMLAAPALLEALEEALDVLDETAEGDREFTIFWNQGIGKMVRDKARAAIEAAK